MAKKTHSSPVDLETTTLADLARMLGKNIAKSLQDTVRHIVREELDRQQQAGR